MANANDVLDRVPELRDLLVSAVAFLMELDDSEGVTVSDVAARIPELDDLFVAAEDFLTELADDGWMEAMVEDWGREDEDDD